MSTRRSGCVDGSDARGEPPTTLSIDGLLALRGVIEAEAPAAASGPSAAEIDAASTGLEQALSALASARGEEGARIGAVLGGLIDQIETLTNAADQQAASRGDGVKLRLKQRVDALLDASGVELDPSRLAQELALLAVKADVREEIDRLHAHIAGARELLTSDQPVGRRFDFLTQEFNREVNTLCSKSQDVALTETGLAMKVVVDQLREQVSNVE